MSNPFTPPNPYTSVPPAVPQAPAPGVQQWATPPMGVPAQRASSGLAIAAIVMSSVALLAVLGMAIFVFAFAAPWGAAPPLTGTASITGGVTTADSLERELTRLIEEAGGDVEALECPETSRVAQGEVAVCRGSVSTFDWTGIVVFEDTEGKFVVLEY